MAYLPSDFPPVLFDFVENRNDSNGPDRVISEEYGEDDDSKDNTDCEEDG